MRVVISEYMILVYRKNKENSRRREICKSYESWTHTRINRVYATDIFFLFWFYFEPKCMSLLLQKHEMQGPVESSRCPVWIIITFQTPSKLHVLPGERMFLQWKPFYHGTREGKMGEKAVTHTFSLFINKSASLSLWLNHVG